MISYLEAQWRVMQACRPIAEGEDIPLGQALGRFLACDIVAEEDLPAWDVSTVDGFAVNCADVANAELCGARPLRIADVVGAEITSHRPMRPGCALKVMTGAGIPPGADAVIKVERTREEEGLVWILAPPAIGQHIRHTGEDLRTGQRVIERGERLLESHLGMLASLGFAIVPVVRRPRVGILATGNEIVEPEADSAKGRVRNANSYSLAGLIQSAGGEAVSLGIAPDDPDALAHLLSEALDECDVLVSTGAVSMGDFDFIRLAMRGANVSVAIEGVNIDPGHPMVFGSKGSALFFGLPGNPVSAMVTFIQFVRPALLRMLGYPYPGIHALRVPTAQELHKGDGRRHFMRGLLFYGKDGELRVRLSGDQSHSTATTMCAANCLIVLEEERCWVDSGDSVIVQILEGAPWVDFGPSWRPN